MSNYSHTSNESCQSPPHTPSVPASPTLRDSLVEISPPPAAASFPLTIVADYEQGTEDNPVASLIELEQTEYRWSLRHRLRPSSPSTQRSMPPSTPQPMGLPPLFASKRPSTLRRSPSLSKKSTDLSRSMSSGHKTTDNCELDWASSAFPMALNVTRAESPLQSRQEEAEWWSQNGSGRSGMGR
jgi:hypothetical protein